MFLKQDVLEYGGKSVALYELSGLQRVEYLEYIQQRTAQYDKEVEEKNEADSRLAFVRMGVDINAWLVSRSLWNGDQQKDVGVMLKDVVGQWSYEALGQGADMVLALSGMALTDSGSKETEESNSPEKS